MDQFLRASVRLICRHGASAKFIQVTEGVYDPQTLSTVNTDKSFSVCLYKNHIKASQYNYPNLVGKDIAEFYLANDDLLFKPAIRDKITYGVDMYSVENIKEHLALGSVVMFTILAVKN